MKTPYEKKYPISNPKKSWRYCGIDCHLVEINKKEGKFCGFTVVPKEHWAFGLSELHSPFIINYNLEHRIINFSRKLSENWYILGFGCGFSKEEKIWNVKKVIEEINKLAYVLSLPPNTYGDGVRCIDVTLM